MSEATETTAGRTFAPPEQLASQANVGPEVYDDAARDRVAFWEAAARRLTWDREWDTALDWTDPPFAKWFVGGKLNVASTCRSRQL